MATPSTRTVRYFGVPLDRDEHDREQNLWLLNLPDAIFGPRPNFLPHCTHAFSVRNGTAGSRRKHVTEQNR